jgi:1-acyl-sn-glycerol-3-phosphate acyltransferase
MPSVRAESSPPIAAHLPAQSLSLAAGWGYLNRSLRGVFFGVGLVVSPICALLSQGFGERIPPLPGKINSWPLQVLVANVVPHRRLRIQFPEADKLRTSRNCAGSKHPSLIDAVILLSVVPNTVCIMRAKLIESVPGGARAPRGFVPNDKGPALIRQGIESSAGENLLIFPEGTRTANQAINPFKHGLP